MRQAAWGLGIIALAATAWLACVGDDPTDSQNQGAQGQACYANGTCLGGLTCVNAHCEPANGDGGGSSSSSSSSSGASSSSSGQSSSGSGSSSGGCTATPAKPGPQCSVGDGGACKSGETCCESGKGVTCSPTCGSGDTVWQCNDAAQCGTGICCISADRQLRLDACGTRSLDSPTSQCVPNAASCAGPRQYRTCTSADDCVGGTDHKDCVVHDIVTVGATHVLVGVCEAR